MDEPTASNTGNSGEGEGIRYEWDTTPAGPVDDGSDVLQIPLAPRGIYPEMDKVPTSEDVQIKNIPGFLHKRFTEAHAQGNLPETLSWYIQAAREAEAMDAPTLEHLEGLSRRAYEARFDKSASASVFAEVSDYIKGLKVTRR